MNTKNNPNEPCEVCGNKYGFLRWYNKKVLCNDCSTKAFKIWLALSSIIILIGGIIIYNFY